MIRQPRIYTSFLIYRIGEIDVNDIELDKTKTEIINDGQNGNAIRFEYHTDQASISITVQSEVESLDIVDKTLWSYICEMNGFKTVNKTGFAFGNNVLLIMLFMRFIHYVITHSRIPFYYLVYFLVIYTDYERFI